MKEAADRTKTQGTTARKASASRGPESSRSMIHPTLQLQRVVGNRAVGRLINRKRARGDGSSAGDQAERQRGLVLQREPAIHGEPSAIPAAVYEAMRSPGEQLDSATRDFMEARFNEDFAQVRIHTDARAGASSDLLGANAYTSGRHIYFAAGKYAPKGEDGKRLLGSRIGPYDSATRKCTVVRSPEQLHRRFGH
jgi:hypothetical protein